METTFVLVTAYSTPSNQGCFRNGLRCSPIISALTRRLGFTYPRMDCGTSFDQLITNGM